MSLFNPNIHPSQFQNPNNNIENKLSIINVQNELNPTFKFDNVSQYTNKLTPNDNQLQDSNTRFLFKNLYGETLLTKLFFSKTNINNLQNIIKMLVFKYTNHVIGNQSINELQIVMRSIFLTYENHPKLFNSTMTKEEKETLFLLYKNEVSKLNELVINATVPNICSNLQQYLDYLRDSQNTLKPITLPTATSVSGLKNYRSITNVLVGDPLS